jgi:hypothetical protein
VNGLSSITILGSHSGVLIVGEPELL